MTAAERTAESNGIVTTYRETPDERLLVFEAASTGDEGAPSARAATGRASTVAIAQNRDGYAMLSVRPVPDGDELERYYGFDMALDHAAEVLGVDPNALPVPDPAADMGL